MKDHVVVLEGGQNEARGLAVIAETKRVLPNKPIRYVVNTHCALRSCERARAVRRRRHHDHHARRTTRTFSRMRSARRGRSSGTRWRRRTGNPRSRAMREKKVLKDDTRTIELHHVTNLDHSDGMLIAFLPKERILFTADFNIPAAGPAGEPVNWNARAERRAVEAGFRPPRAGARAEPGSAVDEGRSAGARERHELKGESLGR